MNQIRSFLLLVAVFSFCCGQNGMEVIERYENGKPKLVITDVDRKKSKYRMMQYTDKGELDCESWVLNHELNGEAKCYYASGSLKSINVFKDDKMVGTGVEYFEGGELSNLRVFANGKEVCERTYSEKGEILFTFYSPIIEIQNDTIYSEEYSLNFKVSLPIHDTLMTGKEFLYAYQFKPLEWKDSIIYPKYHVPISNKKPFIGSLEVEERKDQLFYGHLLDEKKDVYDPFEKKIIVIENKMQ